MQATPTEARYVGSEIPLRSVRDGMRIRPVTRGEAHELARAEYQRIVGLIMSLQPDDWQRPTACALWDVKSMVAHIAGALAGYASWTQFKRQYSPLSYKPYRGKLSEQVDMINAVQVDDRRDRSPEELISELRSAGPKALATRSRIPAPLRAIRFPVGRFGFISLGYLLDTIYSRDMWMHRVDICNATGREMRLSPEHDGRIVALVVRDLTRSLAPRLEGESVLYDLRGPAGGVYRVGENPAPTATIRMDALDFNLLASGRTSLARARALNLIEIEGDTRPADLALKNTAVLY